jgi:predicted component of type VI protein secretion system
MNVQLAWTTISLVLLILAWGLESNRRAALAAVFVLLLGQCCPSWDQLVPLSGLTLSLASFLSAV